MKPSVDIYLDDEKFDTNIEFYIDPNHSFAISIEPSGNIDWAYLWGEFKDKGYDHKILSMSDKTKRTPTIWAIKWNGDLVIDSDSCFSTEKEAISYLSKCSRSSGTIIPLYHLENN